MSELKIQLDFYCDDCGEPLEAQLNDDRYKAHRLNVMPCEKCSVGGLKDSYDEGYRAGIDFAIEKIREAK